MDEYILAAFALDESITLGGVKPLDCTLFLHAALFPCQIEIAICEDGNGGKARRSAVTPLVAAPRGIGLPLEALARLIGITTTTNCHTRLALFGGDCHGKKGGILISLLAPLLVGHLPTPCLRGRRRRWDTPQKIMWRQVRYRHRECIHQATGQAGRGPTGPRPALEPRRVGALRPDWEGTQ